VSGAALGTGRDCGESSTGKIGGSTARSRTYLTPVEVIFTSVQNMDVVVSCSVFDASTQVERIAGRGLRQLESEWSKENLIGFCEARVNHEAETKSEESPDAGPNRHPSLPRMQGNWKPELYYGLSYVRHVWRIGEN